MKARSINHQAYYTNNDSEREYKKLPIWVVNIHFGGDKRDRTADLLNAIQALSQLSYTPNILVGNLP